VARCLPETIAARRTKAELSFLFAEALPVGGDAGFCCDIASLRWIDGERLRSMHRDLRQAYGEVRKEFLPHVWPVWMAHGVQIWYNCSFSGPGWAASNMIGREGALWTTRRK
jgi:hypothetical protein